MKKANGINGDLKGKLIKEFNGLDIKNMPKVTDLNILPGAFVNMEYHLSNGQKIKLLDDNKTYLGNEIKKENSNKCYGFAGDSEYLLVCEYETNGLNPKIIVYKKRNN